MLHITTDLIREILNFNCVDSHLRQKYHYMKIPQGSNSNQSKALSKDFFFLAILKIDVIARRETQLKHWYKHSVTKTKSVLDAY